MTIDNQNWQTFLANTRHELRTPLNAVIGYGEMLLEDCEISDPLEMADDLQEILDGGNRLIELVGRILHPEKIAADIVLDIKIYSDALSEEMQEPLKIVISKSEKLLDKAVHAEEMEWATDLRRINKAGHRLHSLIDDIRTIAQTIDSTENSEEMTLADLNSAGAEMAEEVVKTLHDLSQHAAEQPPQVGHMLVVDDNRENRDILTRRLTRQGHQVTAFDNGEDVLVYLRSKESPPADILLLDVMMPGLNGYEVLSELKNDKQLRHLPVIFLSALDDMESVLRGIELGAQDFLPKPFNPVLLKARLGAMLEKKKLRDLELEYVRNVGTMTSAAIAFEGGDFQPEMLNEVAQRTDALGRLARVFQNMAYEVKAREERLKQEVQQLRIEIDRNKEAARVAEIVDTDYFKDLQQRASKLRQSFQSVSKEPNTVYNSDSDQ